MMKSQTFWGEAGPAINCFQLSERNIWGQTWWDFDILTPQKGGIRCIFFGGKQLLGPVLGANFFFFPRKTTVAYWRGSPLEKLSLKHPWCNWLISFVDSRLAYSMSRPAEASPTPSVSLSIPRPPLQELPAGLPCFLAWGNRCSFSVLV